MTEQFNTDYESLPERAKAFWRTTLGSSVPKDDHDDVLQTAIRLALKYPYNPERKGASGDVLSHDRYLKALFPTALKIWRSTKSVRDDAYSQIEAEQSPEFEAESAFIDCVPDPFTLKDNTRFNGSAVIFREAGLLNEYLQSAPYAAEFLDGCSPLIYHARPFHIPRFEVVPRHHDEQGREIIAIAKHGKHRGRRRRFAKEDLPEAFVDQLENRRSRMSGYISALIPKYLRHFGFFSLERRHMAIVAAVNKRGMTPSQIQAKRRISANTYNAQMASLRRRGWLKVWSEDKQREVLHYFPAYDRCKEFHSAMVADLGKLSIGEVMAFAGPLIEDQLYADEPSDAAIQKEIYAVQSSLRKALEGFEVGLEYDGKLRTFIMDFVEQPIETGMPIEELEERFRLLTDEQRLEIFNEAIRMRRSIYDVIAEDINATFAEILRPREEAARKELEPTLATLLLGSPQPVKIPA